MGKYNTNYDGEVVIANGYFVFNYDIYQQEELEGDGLDGGGSGGITPPDAQTEMVNDTKGMKILWGDFCRGSILLNQPSF